MDDVLRKYPSLNIALIAYLALFLFGNIGLIVMVWRSFKIFRIAIRKD